MVIQGKVKEWCGVGGKDFHERCESVYLSEMMMEDRYDYYLEGVMKCKVIFVIPSFSLVQNKLKVELGVRYPGTLSGD